MYANGKCEQVAMGSIPGSCPGSIFFSSSWLTDVAEMKDLWCSSSLTMINTDMNECVGSICLNLNCPIKEAEGNSR